MSLPPNLGNRLSMAAGMLVRTFLEALADFGLAMRATTVREVQIPAAIQAEGDARQQLAMRNARVTP